MDAASHTIRLLGPWRMEVDHTVKSVRPPVVCSPRQSLPDSTNVIRLSRKFQWVARQEAGIRLFLVFLCKQPPTEVHLDALPLSLQPMHLDAKEAALAFGVEITNTIYLSTQSSHEISVRYDATQALEFSGALLLAAEREPPVWRPSAKRIDEAHLTKFLEEVSHQTERSVQSREDLYRWSIECPEQFWAKVWDFAEIRCESRGVRVLVDAEKMPGARWFPDARLNFAENLLRHRSDVPAVVTWNETGRTATLSFAQLWDEVERLRSGLLESGIGVGDRVAAYMPNEAECVAMMLASASLGAVWSSCSPDFGEAGVSDRLGQIEPKLLLAAAEYSYKGKRLSMQDRIASLVASTPSIQRTVITGEPATAKKTAEAVRGGLTYAEFRQPTVVRPLEFAQLQFDHPLYILFSSGTTGVPKGLIHGAGGTLLQHVKELLLHADVKAGDRVFYFTTCGWMMWNWLVSSLAAQATIILFDGSPFHPEPDVLWRMAEEENITHFGASAKYFAAAEKAGVVPKTRYRLNDLKTIFSTGSPLAPASFDYIYRDVKRDVCLSSISGGTDIVSCFALGDSTLPVHRGEIQCLGLGMKVEAFDEAGTPVKSGGGELVCTQPFPSDAGRVLERPCWRKIQRCLLQCVSQRVAAWRLH